MKVLHLPSKLSILGSPATSERMCDYQHIVGIKFSSLLDPLLSVAVEARPRLQHS